MEIQRFLAQDFRLEEYVPQEIKATRAHKIENETQIAPDSQAEVASRKAMGSMDSELLMPVEAETKGPVDEHGKDYTEKHEPQAFSPSVFSLENSSSEEPKNTNMEVLTKIGKLSSLYDAREKNLPLNPK